MLSGVRANAAYGKYEVEARYVFVLSTAFGGGGTVRFETTDLKGGADTMIQVWDVNNHQRVASNDDCAPGTLASCVEFPAQAGYSYQIIVISYHLSPNTGTCDLIQKQGGIQTSYYNDIPVGGTWTPVNVSAGDTVQTALVNQGTSDTVLFGFDSFGRIIGLDDDGGVGYASKLSATSSMAWVATATYGPGVGLTHVLANDLPGDTDGDGLGPQLEADLCTCDHFWHYVCGKTCNLDNYQDTDGDGLWDDWEVLGKDDAIAPQQLVKWGTNPTRRDIFLQVNPLTVNGQSPAIMEEWQFQRLADMLASLPVENWDGSQGFSLHVDRGGSCTNEHLCGNWGNGGTVVSCFYADPGPCISYGQQHEASYVPVSRQGVFRWALAGPGCGGGGSFVGNPRGINFGSGPSPATCGDTAWATLAHELGHALGLNHNGEVGSVRPNGDPLYGSVINYAYSYSFLGDHENVFDHLQYSRGIIGQTINNLDIDETAPIGQPGTDLTYLTKYPFFFPVDLATRRVDWNRDGVYESSTKALMGAPGMWGLMNEQIVCQNEQVTPDTTTGIEIAGFVRNGTAVIYRFRIDPSTGTLTYGYTSQPTGGWSAWTTLGQSGMFRAGSIPAAVRSTVSGVDKLVLFATKAGGTQLVQYVIAANGAVSGPVYLNTPATSGGVKDPGAVAEGTKVHVFYQDMNSPANQYSRAYMASCSAPSYACGSFATLQSGGSPIDTGVTPAAVLGPNGKVYLLASDYDSYYGKFRLKLFSATPPLSASAWTVANVTWQDAVRGHPPGTIHADRPIVESRPVLLYLPHVLGGSGMTPVADGRGYLMAWWRRSTVLHFLQTEGQLSPAGASFSMGNFRNVWAPGIGMGTVYTNGTPSATVFQGHAHLIKPTQGGAVYHFPFADGLGPCKNQHGDTNDGEVFALNLCSSLHCNGEGVAHCQNRNQPCEVSYSYPPEIVWEPNIRDNMP